jgi:hypothetical protein
VQDIMADYTPQVAESEFNMGVSHLMRIDTLLNGIAENSLMLFESGDNRKCVQNWFYLLTALNKEVDFLFDDDELKEATKFFNDTSKLINEWIRDDVNLEKFEYVWNSLLNLERWIKQQLIKRKMLMKFGKDKTQAIVDL